MPQRVDCQNYILLQRFHLCKGVLVLNTYAWQIYSAPCVCFNYCKRAIILNTPVQEFVHKINLCKVCLASVKSIYAWQEISHTHKYVKVVSEREGETSLIIWPYVHLKIELITCWSSVHLAGCACKNRPRCPKAEDLWACSLHKDCRPELAILSRDTSSILAIILCLEAVYRKLVKNVDTDECSHNRWVFVQIKREG